MTQTYQMKHNPQGTIYSLLTVESDGRMTMTFHGTDREICHEVTENADGWLCYPGAMFPGLASGKWQLMEDGRGKMEDVVETNTNDTNSTNEVAESETTTDNTDCTENKPAPVMQMRNEELEMRNENEEIRNEVAVDEPVIVEQPRPRRERKPRKPRVEHQSSDISPQPSDIDHQPSSTLKAIGMVAAATVALFVIYETGLLIPLGLIGLATGGILK